MGAATFHWKVLHMPMEFFSQRMAGDIQQRQSANASIAQELVNTLGPLVLNAIMMAFYLVVMLRYSWILTLVGLASVAINLAVSRLISKKRVNITRVQMRDSGKLTSSTMAAIEMMETIKAAGAENGYFERWAGYQAGVNTQEMRYAKTDAYLGLIPSVVNSVCDMVILFLGVLFVMRGSFTIGMVMAFQGFLMSFTAPAATFIGAGQTIQEMRTQMERVENVMEYPEDSNMAEGEEQESYDKLSGALEMKHVTFGYSKLAEPLIEDFNLSLKPGSRVAFVGGSGCGKSTPGKLISCLYQPWSGEILFDGKPIREIDRGVFTGSLAVVDQNVILFEDTIAANIKMWDKSIENFEMILAAHRLSTIRDCDEIIVLDHGKAVERGTHEELIVRGGYYTRLVSND